MLIDDPLLDLDSSETTSSFPAGFYKCSNFSDLCSSWVDCVM
ncbi:hypothetical protein ACB092_03G170600 [Castanea dentata]